jgi:hypothetical protein
MMRYLILSAMLLAACPSVQATIYHYVDDQGRKVYVDNPRNIPPRYRDQVDVREEVHRGERSGDGNMQRKQRRQQYESDQRKRELEELQASLEMPLKLVGNRVMVPVKLVYGSRSVNLELVMDTGASATVMHRSALAPLGGHYKPAGVATVADGRSVPTDSIRFDRIELGPYKLDGVTTLVIDNNIRGQGAGLLGMDFLLNARYEIDHERKLLIWEPQRYKQIGTLLQQLDNVPPDSAAPAAPDR